MNLSKNRFIGTSTGLKGRGRMLFFSSRGAFIIYVKKELCSFMGGVGQYFFLVHKGKPEFLEACKGRGLQGKNDCHK